ncbi:MAG: hypothetical protein IJ728_03655 [Selenomonadaceae bacterium]|nr:hypothetical protein [Selenomonadaceae bacterium]
MAKLMIFILGNAAWDYLVEMFGSTSNVVSVAIVLFIVWLIIKFHEEIIGFAVIIFILWLIFH